MDVKTRKKLIEVALPLDAVNAASAREKSIRHGHPSTLHLWWARRPLAAARAVIFAQMVDDPSSFPDLFPTEKAQEKERARLFGIIEELVKWENTTNETVLQKAREEIWASWRRACAENADHPRVRELFDRHRLPAFHDPFAGGGALPLEAQRLGLEAYASDLNPVAVLINKAMIEIPPKFAGQLPVNPVSRASSLVSRAPSPLFDAVTSASSPHPGSEHAGWRSRGYLPHCDSPGAIQHIVFRLADALPAATMARIEGQPTAQRFSAITEALRTGHGARFLADAKIADIVERALLHVDGERYRLLAWCVMPTHVHVLAGQMEGHPLSAIVHAWKSFSANAANNALGRRGAFWAPEYYDRFMRDETQLATARAYIENNPVTAGLCRAPEEWRFSSAWKRPREVTRADVARASSPHRFIYEFRRAGSPRSMGAQGLAEDVRYYGQWMRGEAEKRIGHLYPKVEITAEMARERPDLKPLVGQKLTVIAWLWARMVKSPNPAFANVDVPLASTFMLSTKAGKEAYVEPVIENGGYRFTVKTGKPKDAEAAKNGTKLARGANFRCLMSGTPIPPDHIYGEANAGRMSARLMAIVAEGAQGRIYLAPTPEQEAAALKAMPEWKPEISMPENPRWFSPPLYGLTTYGDLFTDRQLVALTTFSDLVSEAMARVRQDAITACLLDDSKPLRDGGTGPMAYAEAVAALLAFTVSRLADRSSSVCSWDLRDGQGRKPGIRNVFSRQAIPMTWDYAEANPLSEIAASVASAIDRVSDVLDRVPASGSGFASQENASTQRLS
jgi:adenine-specific DNA methylase/REP element-mobilizing transposase RayT